MSSVVIAGDTSGTVTLAAPAVSGTTTITLPATSGTLLQSGTAVTVAQGGTGAATLTANNVILGAGTSAVTFVAPGTSTNVLTSNGTTWTSAAAPSSAPTTAQVGTASAGFAAGDLGSYAFLTTIGTGYAQNDTIAGSSLYYFGINVLSFLGGVSGATSGTVSPSGTWRAMGRSNSGSNDQINIFLRIA